MSERKSWLPAGFAFLSGLPEPKRRRRLLMTIQVYADESGGKASTNHFAMAGLIAPAEKWALFADEWPVCLKERPYMKAFKMSRVCKWQQHLRDGKLRALASIINRHVDLILWSATDLVAHEKTLASWPKPFNEPYFWACHSMVMESCARLWQLGVRERFEMIFDRNDIHGTRAKYWYPILRASLEQQWPLEASILPTDIRFETDEDFVPLQAADLVSGCIRMGADEDGRFLWMHRELPDVNWSSGSQYYDENKLTEMMHNAEFRVMRGMYAAALD